MGIGLLPKLRSGQHLKMNVNIAVNVDPSASDAFEADLRSSLEALDLLGSVRVTREENPVEGGK